jgi:tetratricopeptide (TPR) repeat protein
VWAEHAIMLVEKTFGNRTELLASLNGTIEARPEDSRPYIQAANILLFTRGDLEAARPYIDKAVALAPLEEMGALIDYLIIAERLEEALAQAHRWMEESPNPASFSSLAAVHLARDEIPEALAVARQVSSRWSNAAMTDALVEADALEEAEGLLLRVGYHPPGWLALRGRVREAVARHDELSSRTRQVRGALRYQHDVHTVRAFLLAALGDPDVVWVEIEKSLRTNGPRQVHAWMLAVLGDLKRADGVTITGEHDHHFGYRTYRAIGTWKRGDPEAALRALATIRVPSSNVQRGEILTELGRDREAVDAFRHYRRLRSASRLSSGLDPWNYPRSLYLEAAALNRLGERDAARKVLGRLLHLWERADPDLPLLAQAQALRKKLGEAR